MSDPVGRWLLLEVLFVFLGSFCSLAAYAVRECSESKLIHAAEEGDKKAAKVLPVVQEPDDFCAALRVGAIGFGFFYNIRPWLGWIMVCLAVAFPRLCCGATWWVPEQQWMLYISQLPMHLIACWAYRKMDTVWAPIGALAAVNLGSAILMLFIW